MKSRRLCSSLCAALPKENIELFGFELTDDEMERINGHGFCPDR